MVEVAVLAASLIVAWFVAVVLFRGQLAGDAPALPLVRAPLPLPVPPAPPGTRRPRTPPGGLRLTDALLPASLVLWAVSLRAVNIDAVDDWGLLHALPVTFFVALGLLVVSVAVALTQPGPSMPRLVLHLVAVVVVLHGTVPLLFPEPNYPWVYKHIGVTDYINAHGSLDPSVDIYQNWPAFFTVAAWFSRIAGVDSPLTFAKWAPVYFNLIFCLELAFIFRGLPLRPRERWLALFLFAAGNWVGQDYFAPQALAFVLSLAVFGMVLAWMRAETSPWPVRLARGAARWVARAAPAVDEEPSDDVRLEGWPRAVALGSLVLVFAVLVVAHQLSPFLVLLGLGFLAAAGMVRPRWVVAALAALAIGYFVAHLGYLRSEGHLAGSPFNPREIIASLSNPFDNAHAAGFDAIDPMPGRKLTALGAPVLILGLWVLGSIGALRRLRAGRSALLLAALAVSPAVIAVGENYGGEAIFRIFLFSLPWTAALAASAVVPRSDRRRVGALVVTGVVLAGVVTLFMSAFYGSVELYRVRPGAVEASQYYFAHAPPGSALGLLSPNVPGRVSGNYDLFVSGSAPPPLSSVEPLHNRLLGAADLPILDGLYREHRAATPGNLYLSMSADQETYVRVLGLMPEGAVARLERALAEAPEWRVFFRSPDAVIYEFVGP
jgi:hypothetical protein